MDTFKIISIIFMMIMIYQIYVLNKAVFKDNVEGFEGTTQNTTSGIDDTNAINTLAQIAKDLMKGGVAVPGSINLSNSKTKFGLVNDPDNCFRIKDDRGAQVLAINDAGQIYSKGDGLVLNGNDLTLKGNAGVGGSINLNGDLTFLEAKTIAGKARLHIGGEELLFLLNKAGVIVSKAWGGNGNLTVDGGLTVSGRNILAEIDQMKAQLANKVDINEVIFHRRVHNDGNEGAYFVGDNQHWAGKDNGWTKWRITR